jgi:flavorubredoxin
MEPDHAANIIKFIEKYSDVKVVLTAKALAMVPQFFGVDISDKAIVVKEGDTLELGSHTLAFYMAPMVHWPEVMVTYEQSEKVLFSADAFGKFGTLDTDEDWACEARRYYFNIVGKYGVQAQALLKKAATLDIATICPLHGPVLSENLGYYIDKYNTWSSYEAEDDGVLVAYASVYGNTEAAAKKMAEILEAKGAKKVAITDLARDDMAEALEDAFRYDKLVLASITYDGGIFPCMESFIHHLKAKNYQKRKVGFIENGTWAPIAAKKMKEAMEGLKNIEFAENTVSIKSALKAENIEKMEALADELLK